eukprot:scaffold273_cov526-Pavlova_lutheri.AAC.2
MVNTTQLVVCPGVEPMIRGDEIDTLPTPTRCGKDVTDVCEAARALSRNPVAGNKGLPRIR